MEDTPLNEKENSLEVDNASKSVAPTEESVDSMPFVDSESDFIVDDKAAERKRIRDIIAAGTPELADMDDDEPLPLEQRRKSRKKNKKIKKNENEKIDDLSENDINDGENEASADVKAKGRLAGFLSSIDKGDNGFVFIFTAVNGLVYFVWSIIYVVCLFIRSATFDKTLSHMQMYPEYYNMGGYMLTISSPLFPVLRVFAYILPVALAVWIIGIVVVNKKRKRLCDNRLLVASFIANLVCAMLILFDNYAAGMLF